MDSATDSSASPRVWAITVTYMRPAVLAATLRALQRQSRPPDHILVVDNAGQSEVADAAEDAGARYLASPGNIGPAGGFTLGVASVVREASDDDWVLFVDDDDPPTQGDDLERLLRLALTQSAADRRVAGVGFEGSRYRPSTGTFRRIPDVELQGVIELDTLFGGSLPLYRVSALREVRGPDPDFFWGFEEAELGLHLRSKGFRLLADGDRWLERRLHRQDGRIAAKAGRTPMDKAAWRRYYSVRNSTELAKRHARWWAVPFVALGGAAKGSVAMIRTRRSAAEIVLPIRGAADGILGRLGRRVDPGLNVKSVFPDP